MIDFFFRAPAPFYIIKKGLKLSRDTHTQSLFTDTHSGLFSLMVDKSNSNGSDKGTLMFYTFLVITLRLFPSHSHTHAHAHTLQEMSVLYFHILVRHFSWGKKKSWNVSHWRRWFCLLLTKAVKRFFKKVQLDLKLSSLYCEIEKTKNTNYLCIYFFSCMQIFQNPKIIEVNSLLKLRDIPKLAQFTAR